MVDHHPDRLDATFVRTVQEEGRYSDGAQAYGLSLLVRRTARGHLTRRYYQRLWRDGRQTNVAIGESPVISLSEARDRAIDNVRRARGSRVVLAERSVEPEPAPVKLAPMFREVVEMFIAANADAWRRPKTLVDWRSRVDAYVIPALGDRPVDGIRAADVLDVLTAHWVDKHATMNKVAQAMSKVFAFGIARGLCAVNPADGKVLASALPRVGKTTHLEALPHAGMEDALLAVQQSSASDAIKLAFEWTALMACRSNEARGARWSEIDLEAKMWVVPTERMKADREHRVPLSRPALDVLRRAEHIRDKSGLLFPTAQGGQVHGTTITRLMRSLGVKSTLHGVRSAFRDWAAHEGIDHIQAEIALAHAVGSQTERAYLRADLVEQRRAVMERWAVVVVGEEAFYTP